MKYLYITLLLCSLVACSNKTSTENPKTESLVVTLQLTELPDSFIYDLDSTQSGASDYRWTVSFDTNNDQVISEGDLLLNISLDAREETDQQKINRNELQAYLWVRGDRDPTIATRYSEIALTTTDTSFIFTVPLNFHENLENISTGTQVYVKTTYRDEEEGYIFDYYPSENSYTEGVDTQFLQDSTEDFMQYYNPPSGVDYPFIDINTLTVNITGK